MWVELCAVLALAIFTNWWLRTRKQRRFYQKLKSPPGLPILGNSLEIRNTKTLLDVLLNYSRLCNGIIKINIGPVRKLIFVTDYKLIEFLLSNTKILRKSPAYKNLQPWLGTGLLTSEGEKWKKRRRMITPAFHFKILEEFVDIFEKNTNVLVEKFDNNLGKSVDIYPLIILCTLDIICETAMGTSINAQNDTNSDYVHSVKEMCRIIVERSVSPIEVYDILYRFTRNYPIEKRALNILHNYSLNVIKRRKLENKMRRNISKDDGSGIKRKLVFLDLLIDATIDGRPLADEEIREEVDTFMFEGHDTIASGISFTLFCIANHPDVQKRLYGEQIKLFGDDLSGCCVKYQNLMDMKYLEQVIKEALRLYPSVPFYSRETDQEVDFDGLKIPEGVTFSIFSYGIHRNPQYFPNPDRFDPDRFEGFDGKLPYAYIPFSAGPRNCIGQKFAMLEMKSTVSKIIRNFELLPAAPGHRLELIAETVLKSANGVKIGLKRRKFDKNL